MQLPAGLDALSFLQHIDQELEHAHLVDAAAAAAATAAVPSSIVASTHLRLNLEQGCGSGMIWALLTDQDMDMEKDRIRTRIRIL